MISRSEAEWILRKSGKDFVPTDEDLNPAAWLDELKIARHPVSCDPVAKDHQAGFVSKIDQHYEWTIPRHGKEKRTNETTLLAAGILVFRGEFQAEHFESVNHLTKSLLTLVDKCDVTDHKTKNLYILNKAGEFSAIFRVYIGEMDLDLLAKDKSLEMR